jgi:hypothetical protein
MSAVRLLLLKIGTPIVADEARRFSYAIGAVEKRITLLYPSAEVPMGIVRKGDPAPLLLETSDYYYY